MNAMLRVSAALLLTLVPPEVLSAGERAPKMARLTPKEREQPSHLTKHSQLLIDIPLRGALTEDPVTSPSSRFGVASNREAAPVNAMLTGERLIDWGEKATPINLQALSYLPTELSHKSASEVPFLQFFVLDKVAVAAPNSSRLQPTDKQAATQRNGQTKATGGTSLQRAIVLALQRHPEILSANALARSSKSNIEVAKAAWRPKIGFDAGAGAVQSTGSGSFGVVADQLIYDFGRTPGEIQVAVSGEAEAMARVQLAKETIAGEVAVAFITVSRLNSVLAATDDYIAALEKVMEMIRLRSEAGLSDRSDLILSQVRLDAVRSERISNETALANARSSLAALTGSDITVVAAPAVALKGVSDRLQLENVNNHPEIIAAQQAARTASLQKGVAARSAYPRVGVQGSYRYDPFDKETQASLMLTVRGDVPVDGALQARVAAATEAEQAALFNIDAIRVVARNQFRSAEEGIKGALERIKILDEQIKQAESSRDLYLEQYQLGKRALFELLDAEQQVYLARLSRVSAENDRWESVARKAMAVGGLTAAVGL